MQDLLTENEGPALRCILVEPSHVGNVGAAARAMKTMGLTQLFLVNPRDADVKMAEQAIAMASGAEDVLKNAIIVPSLELALQDVQYSLALSARPREYSPPVKPLREAARYAQQLSHAGACVACVFGNERTGLLNTHIQLCSALLHIPTSSVYSSLNLAQAVQVIAYEWRMAFLEGMDHKQALSLEVPHPVIQEKRAADTMASQSQSEQIQGVSLATGEDIEALFTHLERALIAIDFLDPAAPKKLMPRLRQLFSRTQLEREELNILRGIAKHILRKVGSEG